MFYQQYVVEKEYVRGPEVINDVMQGVAALTGAHARRDAIILYYVQCMLSNRVNIMKICSMTD